MRRAEAIAAARLLALCAAFCLCCGRPDRANKSAPPPAPPRTAEALLDECAGTIRRLEQLQVRIEFERERRLGGESALTSGVFTLAFDKGGAERRPRYRYELLYFGGGEWPVKLLCAADGENRRVYNSQFEEYYNDAQEGGLDELAPDFEKRILLEPYYFLAAALLLHPDPLRYMQTDVDALRLLTLPEDRGRGRERVLLAQATADVLLELDGESALPRSIHVDFLKQGGAAPGRPPAATSAPLCSTLAFQFQYQAVNQPLTTETFQFSAPPGAIEVISPRSLERRRNPPGVLSAEARGRLGQRAFPFQLQDLEQRDVRLTDFENKIVALFFFDSRGGDWRHQLRELNRIVAPYSPLVFQPIAIDLAQVPADQFAALAGTEFPRWRMLRDPFQETKFQFPFTGSNQLVLVDRMQRLAWFHYPPYAKSGTQLKQQLELLLLYQELELEQTGFTETEGAGQLNLKWRLELKDFIDVGVGQLDQLSSHPLLLYSLPGELRYYDPRTKTDGLVFESAAIAQFRQCKLPGLADDYWLSWIHERQESRLAWLNAAGQTLWDYPGRQAVMDALPVPLERGARTGILIGFNADGGAHCLDRAGGLLWKREDLINIWSVGTLDLDADGTDEIVLPGRLGNVLLLDAAGNTLKTITPGVLTSTIRTAAEFGKLRNVIACGGAAKKNEMAVLIDAENKIHWTYSFGVDQRDETAGMAFGNWRAAPFLAMTSLLGNVMILDERGALLYSGRSPKPFLGLLTADFDADGLDEIVLWTKDELQCLAPAPALIKSLGESLE